MTAPSSTIPNAANVLWALADEVLERIISKRNSKPDAGITTD
tara:strand:- start:1242 stop:1367 length:126 start_codon:yes stop_codon:yes gene_type:complete